MSWVSLAIASALLVGGYNFFIKLASSHGTQVLAAVILQSSALLVGVLLLCVMKLKGIPIALSTEGTRFAIFAGVSVAFGEILAFYVYSRGVPASIGAPIIVCGSAAAAALYGLIFLRESLSSTQWLGVVLILLGTILLTGWPKLVRSGM